MAQGQKTEDPRKKIRRNLNKFLLYTVFLSLMPIAIEFFVCLIIDRSLQSKLAYTDEFSFLAILISISNAKDLRKPNIFKSNKDLRKTIRGFNNLFLFGSLIFYTVLVTSSFLDQSNLSYTPRQYNISFGIMILTIVMGFFVQIGEGFKINSNSTKDKGGKGNDTN